MTGKIYVTKARDVLVFTPQLTFITTFKIDLAGFPLVAPDITINNHGQIILYYYYSAGNIQILQPDDGTKIKLIRTKYWGSLGLVCDVHDNIYVMGCNDDSECSISVYTPAGEFIREFENTELSSGETHISLDSHDRVLISDYELRSVFILDKVNGEPVRTISRAGNEKLNRPRGITVQIKKVISLYAIREISVFTSSTQIMNIVLRSETRKILSKTMWM